ncbi:MAG: hypothetical protein ACYCXW_17715 [Solirubrobacteraceae bacterium]
MSGTTNRIAAAVLGVAIVCAAIAIYVGAYLTNAPPSAGAVQTPQGPHLYLATVPAAALTDPHPTWVKYYAVSPTDTNWSTATTYTLPANTVVTVTIYNFDSQTGLRNPFISQVQGTQGGNFQVQTTNNGPTQTVTSFNPDAASHIFSVPEMGLVVPVYGIADNAEEPCSNAPCSLNTSHTTTTFKFKTPGKGLYRWQCFVPCAAGYIDGIGGPMQQVGYMDGYIKVV